LYVNYDFNYKRAVVWDNLSLLYGLSKIKGDNKTAKTDDRLELNSIWGKKKARLVLLGILILKRRWTLVDKMMNISHFFSPVSNWDLVCYGKK
jgi:hypothetical protein